MSAETPAAEQRTSLRSLIAIMIPLAIADLLQSVESSMISAALKTILQQYQDPVAVGWLITIYLLVSAAAAAVVGRLGDIFGRKRVLLIVIVLALIGSAISAVAPTLPGVIFGRALQGVSIAILPLCLGLIREHLPKKRAPVCIGIISATSALGSVVGLVSGGYLTDHFDWRTMFVASAIFSALVWVVVKVMLPSDSPRENRPSVDVVGALLLVCSAATIVYVISASKGAGWLSLEVGGLLAAGILVGAFWVWYELRHPDPLVDVRILARRDVAMLYVSVILACLGSFNLLPFFMMLFQQPVWTGAGLGMTAMIAGTMKIPSSMLTIAGAPVAGWLCGRYGGRLVAASGLALCLAGWVILFFNLDHTIIAVAMLAICALGLAVVYTAWPAIIITIVPAERTSEAVGFLVVVRSLAAAIGAQVMMAALSTSTVTDAAMGSGSFPSPSAWKFAIGLFAVLTAGAILASFAIAPSRRAPGPARASAQEA